MRTESKITVSDLMEMITEAQGIALNLVEDLTDEQMLGPRLPMVNPPLWEIGHVAWFQEKWVLRHLGKAKPIIPEADSLYDSACVPHDSRWELPLPSRRETFRYVQEVRDRVLDRLISIAPNAAEDYFHHLAVFHTGMHAEAFTYTRQTLGYSRPQLLVPPGRVHSEAAGTGSLPGDAEIPGGTYWLGATPDLPFVFDNEKWAHPVPLRTFRIARAPVTNAEYASFVEEGGYQRREFWSDEGWIWREQSGARHPVYWEHGSGGRWFRRSFDRWVALEEVRDPGNLGTIIRTADGVGAGGVMLIGTCCDPYSHEAVRASMGSIFDVPLVRVSPERFPAWAATWRGDRVGTHLDAREDFRSVRYRLPALLVMGSEGPGLSPAIAQACSRLVKIPMAGRLDSLNLAVATALMLYEMRRESLAL